MTSNSPFGSMNEINKPIEKIKEIQTIDTIEELKERVSENNEILCPEKLYEEKEEEDQNTNK